MPSSSQEAPATVEVNFFLMDLSAKISLMDLPAPTQEDTQLHSMDDIHDKS